MVASSAETHEPALIDQAMVALASVLFVAGLLIVLARPTGPIPKAVPAQPVAGSSAPTSAVSEISTATLLSHHSIGFDLPPGKGVEFKYRLDKGAGMTYVWTSSGTVKADFHGEPDGAREGYADTYKASEAREGRGTFLAPTKGIHGWYWENPGTTPVRVSLESAGFYTAAVEFTAAGPIERPIGK